ncbi:uncharacterized protein DNG_04533 [Cephalotrichum gorgonifer]|uniref:Uncharacterized protein n=1 Tax=Cephalotrichum gorgonifer TaxID=2041049 RepID=A0AAE8SUM7_9PEZI|nr:uncharacterized protein DNG_04533 [Cephalotrichum gorgonifer]
MLTNLPNELLQGIAASLDSESGVNALTRTSQHLFRLLDPYLYHHNVQESAGASGKCRERRRRRHRAAPGCTPLSVAILEGHEEIIRILLDLPSTDINHRGTYRQVPLFRAVQEDHPAIAKLLLNQDGIRPNNADEDHITILSCQSR